MPVTSSPLLYSLPRVCWKGRGLGGGVGISTPPLHKPKTMMQQQQQQQLKKHELASVGRLELVSWLNNTQCDYASVTDCSDGVAFCQLLDAVYPGARVHLHKLASTRSSWRIRSVTCAFCATA